MIFANLLNTVLGLGMVYVAILNLELLAYRVWPMAVLAVVVFVSALVSRRGDVQRWQGNTILVLAVALLGLGFLQLAPYDYLTFWGLFWIGILVSILALWGAIQRFDGPGEGSTSP